MERSGWHNGRLLWLAAIVAAFALALAGTALAQGNDEGSGKGRQDVPQGPKAEDHPAPPAHGQGGNQGSGGQAGAAPGQERRNAGAGNGNADRNASPGTPQGNRRGGGNNGNGVGNGGGDGARPAAPQGNAGGGQGQADDGEGKREGKGRSKRESKSNNGSAHQKTTFCHATGSDKNPYVEVTTNNRSLPNAHDVHQDHEDIIPVNGDCPDGEAGPSSAGGQDTETCPVANPTPGNAVSQSVANAMSAVVQGIAALAERNGAEIADNGCGNGNGNRNSSGGGSGNGNGNTPARNENANRGEGHTPVTLCHATGSDTNPWVVITIDDDGHLHGHEDHEGDIVPAPAGGCPTQGGTPPAGGGEQGQQQQAQQPQAPAEQQVAGQQAQGEAPFDQDNVPSAGGPVGEDRGGVLGEHAAGAPAETAQVRGTTASGGDDEDDELPFTGLALGGLLLAAALALVIGFTLRRVSRQS